ncbi:hypothetical protein [Methylobacterium iners]|uniref:Uncharacterized protein n=1 Tax=Methylobacterium iners TaxID=418707 RepID=A0ABQ4RZJ5_9HYPH|nr:hypothetical protein [Methylobacterium iners]GJD96275.1 hypothetical protein OCOJLMKI_3495 [Methylobacterium iners]
MDDPFAVAMLAYESQTVVALRLVKLAWGGPAAQAEASQMISEKISASMEAAGSLMLGGSHDAVIARYRELVAENTKRLMSP